MKCQLRIIRILALFAGLWIGAIAGAATEKANSGSFTGVISSLSGSAQLDSKGERKTLKVGQVITTGDTIETATGTLVKINMGGKYSVSVFGDSQLEIIKSAEGLSLLLNKGQVRATFQSKSKQSKPHMQVATLTAVTGLSGSDFSIEQRDPERAVLTAFSGAVAFGEKDEQGQMNRPMLVLPGCQGIVRKGYGMESMKKVSVAELRRIQEYSKKKTN